MNEATTSDHHANTFTLDRLLGVTPRKPAPNDESHEILDNLRRLIPRYFFLARMNGGRGEELGFAWQDLKAESASGHAQLLHGILEALPLSAWYVNRRGEVQFANPADEILWSGVKKPAPEEMSAYHDWRRSLQARIHGENWGMARALSSGTPVHRELREVACWDGTLKTILHSAVPLFASDHEIQGALVVNEDITEKRRLERQMLRAQRLESIGTLAGGIAHDLNNVLAPILMSCDLLRQAARDETSRNLIATIQTSAKRGVELVQQVVSFARGSEACRAAVRLRSIVQEMADIARETFPKGIRVRAHVPENLWQVTGDATQLHQVLLNLCVNARDAMPDGGELVITARNVPAGAANLPGHPEAGPGPHVLLKVSDTGMGISRDIQEKIFDSFFTTKAPGKGTGLGLATTLGIVKSHGGFIGLHSEPGKGATFEVWLPADVTRRPVAAPPAAGRSPRGHGELILVVDDEAAVRELTRQTLEAHGYGVLSAANGADAVEIYARHQHEIEVVITDMMMPVMDGLLVVRRLREINSAVPIIALSGSCDTGRWAKIMGEGAKAFLSKPFAVDELLKTVREMLRAR